MIHSASPLTRPAVIVAWFEVLDGSVWKLWSLPAGTVVGLVDQLNILYYIKSTYANFGSKKNGDTLIRYMLITYDVWEIRTMKYNMTMNFDRTDSNMENRIILSIFPFIQRDGC